MPTEPAKPMTACRYCSRAQRPTRTSASVDKQQQQQFQQPVSNQKQQSFIFLSILFRLFNIFFFLPVVSVYVKKKLLSCRFTVGCTNNFQILTKVYLSFSFRSCSIKTRINKAIRNLLVLMTKKHYIIPWFE
jgi:hypothetical protein